MLRLFTDTDTDITPEIAKKYGYNLISMPYTVDGKDIYPYEDFETFDSKAFYDMLRGGTIPSTSALNPAKYTAYFEPVFAAGDDILYVHFSSAMSATFGFMELAMKKLRERYPERKLYTVDTKGITLGSFNIVEEIGDMYLAGKTVEEILECQRPRSTNSPRTFTRMTLNSSKNRDGSADLPPLWDPLSGSDP